MDGVLDFGIGKSESAGAPARRRPLDGQASSRLRNLGGDRCFFGLDDDFGCQRQSGTSNGNSALTDHKLSCGQRNDKADDLCKSDGCQKRGREVVSIADNTPPAINFLQNSDMSHRPQRNHLVVPTAVVATLTPAAAPPISMVKRVMKQAGDMFFSGPKMTPTKRCAGRVRTQLSRSNPAFTSILEEYEKEKNSQEIFEFCLVQTRLE